MLHGLDYPINKRTSSAGGFRKVSVAKMRVTLVQRHRRQCCQRRRSQNVTKHPVIDGCGDTVTSAARGRGVNAVTITITNGM